MTENTQQSRVRMNFTTNAKGFAQMDITTEFPSVEEAGEAMDLAVKTLRNVLSKHNITEAIAS